MVNPGFYRGIVVNNVDPDNKGNCKVYVPGVYPGAGLTDADILPWAEPVMPVFGGAGLSTSEGVKFSSTGWTSVPGVGTYVWVFFEGNDQNYPRFFAAAQAGDAWMSEHEMQHVLSTENFRITIDENPTNSATMKTDTVDGNKTNQNTRARIEIESDAVALDLVIKGDVNILIDGDKYEKVTGDRYTEVVGNDTLVVGKNTQETHGGDLDSSRDGNSSDVVKGTRKETTLKGKSENVGQNKSTFVGGNNNLNAGGSNIQTAGGLHDHL
jgi:hypothetical protein